MADMHLRSPTVRHAAFFVWYDGLRHGAPRMMHCYAWAQSFV